EQALEDNADFFFVGEAINLTLDYRFRNPQWVLHRRQLICQEGLVGRSQGTDQHLEILFLLGGERIADRSLQHLPHTAPIVVQVVRPRLEIAWSTAHQPSENQATANVQETPAPALRFAQ